MAAIIGSPTRYIQGKGEMKNLCSYADKFGKNLFILTSASGRKRVEPAINEGNKDSNLTYDVFNGECCMTEINRIIKIVEETGSDVIIGIGGGKFLNAPLYPHLAFYFMPIENECGKRVFKQFTSFPTQIVCEKYKSVRINFFKQNHSCRWNSVRGSCGKRHGIGFGNV